MMRPLAGYCSGGSLGDVARSANAGRTILRVAVRLGLLVALAGLSSTPRDAAAQMAEPVHLEVTGLFDEGQGQDSYATFSISAENRTTQNLQGKILLRVRDFRTSATEYESRLDLAPRSKRQVRMSVWVGDNGSTVEAEFQAAGRVLGKTIQHLGYGEQRPRVVVLANPPRLRSALLDLEVETGSASPYGGAPRYVQAAVGVVPFDTKNGDPLLPTTALGWANVDLLVASAPLLERIAGAEREALLGWVHSGGQLLVFPRTPADVRQPLLRSLLGDVEWLERESVMPDTLSFVPAAARGAALRGGSAFRTEAFGGSTQVGFGRVWVATFDGTAPPHVDADETRELIRSILWAPKVRGVDAPVFTFGRGADAFDGGWMANGTFEDLRAALDPNEAYRPALGLVAFVLLLYVFVVGPLNFAYVGRKNRPILALVTTPIAAVACLLVMLLVGYIGKGTRMRYRAVELTELLEGEELGPQRRYAGLFLTRPSTFDMDGPVHGRARVLRGSAAGRAPRVDLSGERQHLEDVRGGLWETVFTRTDQVASLGGEVTFERDGQRVVGVRNGTPHVLRGAIVIDALGAVYQVGDLPPGGQRPVPSVSALRIGEAGSGFYSEHDDRLPPLLRALRIDEERTKTMYGLSMALGGSLQTPPMPALWATIDAPEGFEEAERFTREFDVRLVRVVPRVQGSALRRAPTTSSDDPLPDDAAGAATAGDDAEAIGAEDVEVDAGVGGTSPDGTSPDGTGVDGADVDGTDVDGDAEGDLETLAPGALGSGIPDAHGTIAAPATEGGVP